MWKLLLLSLASQGSVKVCPKKAGGLMIELYLFDFLCENRNKKMERHMLTKKKKKSVFPKAHMSLELEDTGLASVGVWE